LGTLYAREERKRRRVQVCVCVASVFMRQSHRDGFFFLAIMLSVIPAEGILGHGSNLTFGTTDVDALRELVAECRRLKDASGTCLSSEHSSIGSLPHSLCGKNLTQQS